MRTLLLTLLLVPMMSFGQSKKKQIIALQEKADSITSVLDSQLEKLTDDEKTNKSEIELISLKKEDIKIAKSYLRKAKRKVKIGNIFTTITVSISAVGTALLWNYLDGYFDFTPLLLGADGVLIIVGQSVNLPFKKPVPNNPPEPIPILLCNK